MPAPAIARPGDNGRMDWRRPLAILAAVALGAGAWRGGGWRGLALLGSGLVLWGLLHFHRIASVMQRAAHRPVGHVDSAVMLNSRLQPGQRLLHVLALTRALGERLTEPGADPETYRWRDPGQASVTAEFRRGRLARWQLQRPAQPPDQAPGGTPEA